MTQPFHVQLCPLGRVANDTLHQLHAIVGKNLPPDTERTLASHTGDVLTVAAQHLRDSHVFIAAFRSGHEVYFTGQRLPPYVTPEAAVTAAYIQDKFQPLNPQLANPQPA
jgi:hypothetical protein